ncbi:hypothetical protein AB4Z32_21165 [Massilia sp. 2TAF26]|uniref:hypothetical protein n=1 Tax=Massilia sp. 2TAF26 TaxID=3233012 RepID=UPI003F95055F
MFKKIFTKNSQSSSAVSLLPLSGDDLGRVRERCRALVRKRAAISAGISAVPIPGVDMVSDLASFASMVEDINKDFGLTPQQIEALQPHMRVAAYQAMAALGGTLVGKIVTRELVLKLLRKSGAKLAAKSAARIVPLAGQLASAAIGFALFRQMGYQHVEACARVAQEVGKAVLDQEQPAQG